MFLELNTKQTIFKGSIVALSVSDFHTWFPALLLFGTCEAGQKNRSETFGKGAEMSVTLLTSIAFTYLINWDHQHRY